MSRLNNERVQLQIEARKVARVVTRDLRAVGCQVTGAELCTFWNGQNYRSSVGRWRYLRRTHARKFGDVR